MNNDYTISGLDGIKSLEDLKGVLNKVVEDQAADKNTFYMAKIDGEFNINSYFVLKYSYRNSEKCKPEGCREYQVIREN